MLIPFAIKSRKKRGVVRFELPGSIQCPQGRAWLGHYSFITFPHYNSELSHVIPGTGEEETAEAMVDGCEERENGRQKQNGERTMESGGERTPRAHPSSFYFPSRCWVGSSRSAFCLGNSPINYDCRVWECNISFPLCCWGSLRPKLSGFPKHLAVWSC